jgi:plastocyanin
MMSIGRRQFVISACALPVVAATPAMAASYQVTIQGFAFSPASFEVNAGDTIVFVNADNAPHTATADDGAFDTGRIDPGQSAEVTVPAGSHPFHCAFHQGMKGVATGK